MQYVPLGRTGVRVSELCFGTMSFGGDADEKTSRDLFHACLDAGINFFDTADVYSAGQSEEILGRLVGGMRHELVIATKAHFPTGPDVNARGLSRRHLRLALEASLKRLRMDFVDVYYAHGFDPHTPMEETLGACADLVRQGKALYIGVSNWAAWQVARALGLAEAGALQAIHVIQPMYNLVKRQAEVELLPMAQASGLGAVTYSPLGGGLLSGKYSAAAPAASGRLIDNQMYALRYAPRHYREVADRFVRHAQDRGLHPASLAVAWVRSHPAVTAAILGARDVEQLRPALEAVRVRMTPEWRAEIARMSPEPPPATDRLEEQSGFVYGSTGQDAPRREDSSRL